MLRVRARCSLPLPYPAPRRSALRVAAVATAGPAHASSTRQPPPRSRKLVDPATLVGSQHASVQVSDYGGDISLDAYMRLPPEQYNELDPQMIKSLGGSTFLLKVPRLTLFNVWLEPEVVVSVTAAEAGVVFESVECRLHGSDLVQQLKLDQRFVLYFHTLLMWQPGSSAAALSTTHGSSSAGSSGNGGGQIVAETEVQVWSEVLGPFRAIPRFVLQATGNAVLGALMQALLPIFLTKLAGDYARWSTDAAYRARRAANLAKP